MDFLSNLEYYRGKTRHFGYIKIELEQQEIKIQPIK